MARFAHSDVTTIPQESEERPLTPPQSLDNVNERLLIFSTGDKTFTPHKIG